MIFSCRAASKKARVPVTSTSQCWWASLSFMPYIHEVYNSIHTYRASTALHFQQSPLTFHFPLQIPPKGVSVLSNLAHNACV